VSHIDDLVNDLCPAGVDFRSLGEIGSFFGGLTGKSKADFTGGNARFVSYVNIYNNISVNTSTDDFVSVGPEERQRTLKRGDVLFTGSSETPNEVGMSSVVTSHIQEPLYLNSFSIGYRLNDPSMFDPNFMKYLFRSSSIRKQIIGTASGVTRFNVSKSRLAKVSIPIPPLEVQQEIPKILDRFRDHESELETELEAEVEARKHQYEYYRHNLLTFPENEALWTTLGEISIKVSSGGTPLVGRSEYYVDGTIPWLRTQEVRFAEVWDTEMRITEQAVRETSAKWIPANCVIIAISGATAGRSAINKIPLTTNQHCCNFEIDPAQANYRYIFHWVRSQYEQIKALGHGARSDLNAGIIKGVKVPIPSLDAQNHIVDVLDKFDSLGTDLSISLPAELSARRAQYEYYVDRILTFEEKST
jgi:type I restriction enzyme S subunit